MAMRAAHLSASQLSKRACNGGLPMASTTLLQGARAATQLRQFSSVGAKMSETLAGELKHEKEVYKQPELMKAFLSKSDWKFEDKSSDSTMTLSKKTPDGLKVKIEYQYAGPFTPGPESEADEAAEGQEGSDAGEAGSATDFSVVVEKPDGTGLVFYCVTDSQDPASRFSIGNVKAFSTEEEQTSMTGYSGPDFEDLDDAMQEQLDQWLNEVGVTEELCDFIDASAVDKEQREYMHWLQSVQAFFSK